MSDAALKTYQERLNGKRISDLEQNPELRAFVKEYQSQHGFHLHLKNGDELDPCDGDHGSTVKSLHQEHYHLDNDSHKHNQREDKAGQGLLEKLINNISHNKSIPKVIKPILARALINITNIFLAQGVSLPLHHMHCPNEITSSTAIASMHLLNHGTQKWGNLSKNLITIIPFVALHRVIKIPSFILRSSLGLAISLGEQLKSTDTQESILSKLKKTFTKDASIFFMKLAQMETMLNTAIPLGQFIAKNISNKSLAFISQNLAMAGAFTLIPEIFTALKSRNSNDSNHNKLNQAVLSAELLECPVCGEAHAADVHLAEISEGVSIAGASNASEQDKLHSLVHHEGFN